MNDLNDTMRCIEYTLEALEDDGRNRHPFFAKQMSEAESILKKRLAALELALKGMEKY